MLLLLGGRYTAGRAPLLLLLLSLLLLEFCQLPS
jgi:hypothetical protein